MCSWQERLHVMRKQSTVLCGFVRFRSLLTSYHDQRYTAQILHEDCKIVVEIRCEEDSLQRVARVKKLLFGVRLYDHMTM